MAGMAVVDVLLLLLELMMTIVCLVVVTSVTIVTVPLRADVARRIAAAIATEATTIAKETMVYERID